MIVYDLIPYIQYIKDADGQPTGQSIITYGKVLEVNFTGRTWKSVSSVSILQVFDVESYIKEVHQNKNPAYSFAHKIREIEIKELPPEFVLDLKHKKIIK